MPTFLTDPIWGERLAAPRLLAVALGCLAVALVWLAVGAALLRRARQRIPVRIHVAGTRGKSTTTRFIAAGLRDGTRVVYAKTTGTEPRLILPDGSEAPFPRFGPASIREQGRFLSVAARGGADVVVAECMAIRPELVWASEALYLSATLLVVTNARPDHFEEIGEEPNAMADALAGAIPSGGTVVIAAEAATERFLARAKVLGASLIVVETAGLAPEEANRTLARAVCAHLGVPASEADARMAKAGPDPGHYAERNLVVAGKPLRFANAFACNDVGSLERLWDGAEDAPRAIVVLNARADRPLRTRAFLRFLASRTPRPILFVAGDRLAAVLARRAGFAASDVRRLTAVGRAALAEIAAAAAPGATIWGIGNYAGAGRELARTVAEEGEGC